MVENAGRKGEDADRSSIHSADSENLTVLPLKNSSTSLIVQAGPYLFPSRFLSSARHIDADFPGEMALNL